MRQYSANVLGQFLKTANGRRVLAEWLKSRRLVEKSFSLCGSKAESATRHRAVRWQRGGRPDTALGRLHRLVMAELDERRIAFGKRVFEPDFAAFVADWGKKARGNDRECGVSLHFSEIFDFSQQVFKNFLGKSSRGFLQESYGFWI